VLRLGGVTGSTLSGSWPSCRGRATRGLSELGLRRRPPQGGLGRLPVGPGYLWERWLLLSTMRCLLELVALTAGSRGARGWPEPGRQARYPIGLSPTSAGAVA
jgi:hypothetical protein